MKRSILGVIPLKFLNSEHNIIYTARGSEAISKVARPKKKKNDDKLPDVCLIAIAPIEKQKDIFNTCIFLFLCALQRSKLSNRATLTMACWPVFGISDSQ